MLDLEAEKEFGAHIWSFDSTHEYFDSWEYEPPTLIELREISDFRFGANFFWKNKIYFTQELTSIFKSFLDLDLGIDSWISKTK